MTFQIVYIELCDLGVIQALNRVEIHWTFIIRPLFEFYC